MMNEKKKLGVVVAIEIDAVLSKYGKPAEVNEKNGYTVRRFETEKFDMYVVDSGAGEISAATSTQVLISEYGVDMILNFGVVGALSEEMKSTELCIVEKIIHYDFTTDGWLNLKPGQYPGHSSEYISASPELIEKAVEIEPSLKKVVCASADKFVDAAEDKKALREKFGADICEMESAGVVITCERNGVPCLIIKAVADGLTGGGKEFFAALGEASEECFNVADRIVREINF